MADNGKLFADLKALGDKDAENAGRQLMAKTTVALRVNDGASDLTKKIAANEAFGQAVATIRTAAIGKLEALYKTGAVPSGQEEEAQKFRTAAYNFGGQELVNAIDEYAKGCKTPNNTCQDGTGQTPGEAKSNFANILAKKDGVLPTALADGVSAVAESEKSSKPVTPDEAATTLEIPYTPVPTRKTDLIRK